MSSAAPAPVDQHEALLDEWVAKRREIAVLQAESADILARRWALMQDDVADAPLHRDAIERSMIAEYSAAGRLSKGSVEFAFGDARVLHEDLPVTLAAHRRGDITAAHVREIVREADVVREAIRSGDAAPETLELYEAAVLEVGERDTPARTRVHARQVAAALSGSTLMQRHADAAAERCVTVRSIGDGLALLQAVLPEHLAIAIHDRLTKMARHLARHPEDRDPVLPPLEPAPDAGMPDDGLHHDDGDGLTVDEASRWEAIERALASDPLFHDDSPCILHLPADARTADQLRADLLTDLLLTSDPSDAHGTGLDGITATIQVTVSATTLAGADDGPAELDGTGPLHPDIARALAGRHTGWTRLFLDPTGMVTETDTYTPTESMRRFLRARDEHCRFPGCRQPVHRCDIDHNHDHAKGGPTATCNLAHLCRAHHMLKHPDIPEAHRWTARQLPDRSVEWTSPTGRTYGDAAPRRVMFVPADPPRSGSPGGRDPDHRSTDDVGATADVTTSAPICEAIAPF